MEAPQLKDQMRNELALIEQNIDRALLSPEALKKIVLGLVTDEKYDEAVSELESFILYKTEFPEFQPKAVRYVKHCVDLIHAIRAKKRFPGMHSLTRSKLQELNEKTMDHFNELAFSLRKIEIIRMQLQSQDARSTVWFMRSVVHAVAIVALCALILEVSGPIYQSGLLVLDDTLTMVIDWIFGLMS